MSSNSPTIRILGQFIEFLEESELPFDERKEVYDSLLDALEEFEFHKKDILEMLDLDSAFNMSYNERYLEVRKEEDDEEHLYDDE